MQSGPVGRSNVLILMVGTPWKRPRSSRLHSEQCDYRAPTNEAPEVSSGLPSLWLRAGPTVSETPLVSTRPDHIQFGCGISRRCGRTRDTPRIYMGSLCSRIENSR